MSTHFLGDERKAKRWRRREAQARVIALSMADLENKRGLLSVAEGYKRLPSAEVRAAKQLIDGAGFRQP